MTTSRTPLLRKKWPLLALVLAAILALILVIWQLQTSPETNDAYVYADTIDVVPEVSGRIVEMPIRDNQRVKKGDLLFRIDPRPYQAMLDDAKARLTTLDAQIMLTQRTIKAQEYNAQSVAAAVERARALVKQTTSTRIRLEPLVPQGFASQEDLDQARTAEKAARAELEATLLQAKQASAAVTGVDAMVAQRAGVLAQIALAELHLEFTEVRAPFNGVVVALKTTVGQYASALKPVFTLLDDDRWYVIANFRETDLNNVRPGVAARITVMTNHNRTFNGVVDSVGSGVLPEGGSVIEGLPLIQKSINWVHVSQRFPVKIAVSDPDPELFRMGASASAVLQPAYENGPLAHELAAPFYARVKGQDEVTKKQYLDMNMWLPGDILLKADKMCMAHSLELRVPFLDKKVLEFAETVPVDYRIQGTDTKIVMRHAANKTLPDEWANRPKKGFPVPIRYWLREEKYYNIVKEYFTSDYAAVFFKPDALMKLLDDHFHERANNQRKIWTVFTFLVWYKRFFVDEK